jgi:2-hydroxychromene-2-carboxylate isomerase
VSVNIDYYFAPNSPWTYLGHARLASIADTAGAALRVLPIDLGGKVFPVSGGLPLGKRAPQRQAYRLVELERFSRWLNLPLIPKPMFFPVATDDASRLIIAVDLKHGSTAAMRLTGAILAAVWAQQRNIADAATLAAILVENGLPPEPLEYSHSQAVHERFDANTEAAIALGVFGAPSYVIEGEIFWGQDRLDFVERRLSTFQGA